MNLLYLDEIEKNIRQIEADGGFEGRRLVIFGANKPTEKMILFLRARDIETSCVIDNNPKVTGKSMCGVMILTPEEGILGYEEETMVLIASKYYDEMKNQVISLGCREDRVYQMVVYQNYSTEWDVFEKAESNIYNGFRCHNELLDEFGKDTWIIMCPYNGIGDMYFIGAYLPAYCRQMKLDNIAVTVVSNTCYRVAKMFGIKNIKKLEQSISDDLMKYASYMGKDATRITVFTHTSIHWDVLMNFEKADRMDWGVMFRNVLMDIGSSAKSTPVNSAAVSQAEDFAKQNGLKRKKTAIISPYANTIIGIEDDIWNCVTECLRKKGYEVFTNSIGETEPPICGTKALAFPIEIAREVVELAGVFVGIRSGLCDVIEDADADIFILYPDSRQKFFNLKAMGFGANVKEIDCELFDAADVIEKGLMHNE